MSESCSLHEPFKKRFLRNWQWRNFALLHILDGSLNNNPKVDSHFST